MHVRTSTKSEDRGKGATGLRGGWKPVAKGRFSGEDDLTGAVNISDSRKNSFFGFAAFE
jgi:hypothetical protein